MKVITYIDGFNLYHSIKDIVKKDSMLEYIKWQNIHKLSKNFLAKNDENKIYFFTAYPYWKKESVNRHKIYVKILQDMGIEVILGSFKNKSFKRINCHALIPKYEKKQTDVNIAIQILKDLYTNRPDVIQIISGDTDLIPPLQVAKDMGVHIDMVFPFGRAVNEFKKINPRKISNIKIEHLKKCYIGDTYMLQNEILRCPYIVSLNKK